MSGTNSQGPLSLKSGRKEACEALSSRRMRKSGSFHPRAWQFEVVSLFWNRPLAFLVLMIRGGLLLLVGILVYLYSSYPGQRSSELTNRSRACEVCALLCSSFRSFLAGASVGRLAAAWVGVRQAHEFQDFYEPRLLA
jgi:hypothetical protein